LDWAQILLSLVVMLVALYIAPAGRSRRGVPATTRVAGFGVALVGLSYFVGGFEGSAIEGPLSDRVEAYSALAGGPGGARGPDLAGARPVKQSEDLVRGRSRKRLPRQP
jgi:hypothetical protein